MSTEGYPANPDNDELDPSSDGEELDLYKSLDEADRDLAEGRTRPLSDVIAELETEEGVETDEPTL